ncbi:Ribosomal protein L11 methyltransferase [uncultured archaeon]|nr:Ribosomal protein L11 methyltransferase [uncultured archaeon]
MVQTKIPEITQNQMRFMMSRKKSERVIVNGISAEIQPYMFPPVSPYSYSTRILLEDMHFKKDERVLEIGTGCGILSVFAAKQGARVDGVDILPECVEFSLRNAITNGVFERTKFYYSNMFQNTDAHYDTVLCNLPILNGDLPDKNSAWYSLFDPNFKFHIQLFEEGRKYTQRIIMAHADLIGKKDFADLESLAEQNGWNVSRVHSRNYATQEWRSYEFKYRGNLKK